MLYFTPGPTQLYPTVPQYLLDAIQLDILSISHRSNTYIDIHQGVWEKMKQLYNIPDDYVMFLTGSGTACMERVIQNTVMKESFHFVDGSFSRRFCEISRDLGKTAHRIQVPLGEGFVFENIHIPPTAELITIAAVETSAGIQISPQQVYKLREKNPQALVVIDVVSAAPCYDFDMSLVDGMILSVQKGFGLPAGLGVMIVSPRALEKAEQLQQQGHCVGSFGAWPLIAQKARNFQTLETPNVLALFLLNRVLGDMLERGIETIRAEAEEKMGMIQNTIDNHPLFRWYVKNSNWRAQSVTVIEYHEPNKVLDFMKKHGYTLGGGYGEDKHKQFRIANFPATSPAQMKKMLSILSKFQ